MLSAWGDFLQLTTLTKVNSTFSSQLKPLEEALTAAGSLGPPFVCPQGLREAHCNLPHLEFAG